MAESKSKAKGRKIGRNAKRPAQKRYVAEQRSEKNRRIRAARHAAACEAKKDGPKVCRGTARAIRRANPLSASV